MSEADDKLAAAESLREEARQLIGTIQSTDDEDQANDSTYRLIDVVDQIAEYQEEARVLYEEERARWIEIQKNHRACVALPDEVIYNMIQVPDDVHVSAVDYDSLRQCFIVYMCSERFPLTEQGSEAHLIQALYEVEEGRQLIRFDFPMYPPNEDEEPDAEA